MFAPALRDIRYTVIHSLVQFYAACIPVENAYQNGIGCCCNIKYVHDTYMYLVSVETRPVRFKQKVD